MGLPGRNDLCHCGSSKKYKKCCLQKDEDKAQQERSTQKEQVRAQENLLPISSSNSPHSELEPKVYEPENENIIKLWDDLKKLKYPQDLNNSLATIESFIRDFPHLVQESDVIDEIFSMEDFLYRDGRYDEYIELLQKIEKLAPEFYRSEAGWFDVPRLRHAIATRQINQIAPLLSYFKENPVPHADQLKEAIDLLAWSDAGEELHNLVHATYKQLVDSEEIWNSDFVTEWIYFDIYYTTATSSLSLDDCVEKIIQLLAGHFELIDSEEPFNKEFIKNVVRWIREDTLLWDCPFGEMNKLIDFFHCMGWQFFKHIKVTNNCSIYQASFIQKQLYDFWMHYRAEKRPKTSIYFITKNRITEFCNMTKSITSVGFLQAVYFFADYLHNHDKIDEKTRQDLQNACVEQYKGDLESSNDCYPAPSLITNFPFIKDWERR